MIIRPAVRGDLPGIVRIHNQAIEAGATGHRETFTPECRTDWFFRHSAERPILVAEVAGNMVGWVNLSDYRSGRQALRYTAEISYYVDASARRQGTGTALVRSILDLCRSNGVRTVLAILLANNIGSVGLLESQGFARWGELPGVASLDGHDVDHYYYGITVTPG